MMVELENGNDIAEDFAVPNAEMGDSEGDELNNNATLTLPLEDFGLNLKMATILPRISPSLIQKWTTAKVTSLTTMSLSLYPSRISG